MKPDQKPGFFVMLWELLYPFLVYELISTVVSVVMSMLLVSLNPSAFETGSNLNEMALAISGLIAEHYGEIAAVSAGLTLPLLIFLYRNDRRKEKAAAVYEAWEAVAFYHYIVALIMGVSACLALNHLMVFSRLTELLSDGYEATAALLFQGKIVLEIVFAGILIPIVEELIFRGLTYRRLRWYLNPVPAMLLSALFFGAVHGNLLQGIYAFILGMLLAFTYERFHSILAPILIHAGANILSVLISDAHILDFVYEEDSLFLIVTGVALVIFIITFYLIATYVYPRKKADSPKQAERS